MRTGHPRKRLDAWNGLARGVGQTGDPPNLYRVYGIDAGAILDAAAQICLG